MNPLYIDPSLMSSSGIPLADLPRDPGTGNIIVHCRECGRPVRPRKTKKAQYPHTVGYGAWGKCGGCYAFGHDGLYLVRSQLPETLRHAVNNAPRHVYAAPEQTEISIEELMPGSAVRGER